MAVTSKKRVSIRSRLTAIRRTRQMVSDQIDIIDRAAPDRDAPPGDGPGADLAGEAARISAAAGALPPQ